MIIVLMYKYYRPPSYYSAPRRLQAYIWAFCNGSYTHYYVQHYCSIKLSKNYLISSVLYMQIRLFDQAIMSAHNMSPHVLISDRLLLLTFPATTILLGRSLDFNNRDSDENNGDSDYHNWGYGFVHSHMGAVLPLAIGMFIASLTNLTRCCQSACVI